MRIAVAVGGTGGHIYPGIALASSLQSLEPGIELIFFGVSGGLDADIFEGRSEVILLPSQSLPRRSISGLLSFAVSQLKAFSTSRRAIKEKQFDAVVGMGGYGSFAPLVAAKLTGVPTLIHEQNAQPGLANRMLGKLASKVALSYLSASSFFNEKKIKVTGNPVRPAVLEKIGREKAAASLGIRPDMPTVLIMGGSRGAQSINQQVLKIAHQKTGYQIVHISGARDYDWVREEAPSKEENPNYLLLSYATEMAPIYSCSDLVVSRAGAGSIAEITARGLPSLLVPYPYATGGHQRLNALYLKECGATEIIEDKDLSSGILQQKIESILGDDIVRREMSSASERQGHPDASNELAKMVLDLKKGKTADE